MTVTAARTKSLRRALHNRRNAATSIMRIADTRTTAPSAACGTNRKTGVRITRVTATNPAAATLDSWVLAPASATTKLRESLELAG